MEIALLIGSFGSYTNKQLSKSHSKSRATAGLFLETPIQGYSRAAWGAKRRSEEIVF